MGPILHPITTIFDWLENPWMVELAGKEQYGYRQYRVDTPEKEYKAVFTVWSWETKTKEYVILFFQEQKLNYGFGLSRQKIIPVGLRPCRCVGVDRVDIDPITNNM